MSIESKIPTDEINLKSLSLEEPEMVANLDFDPKKEIRPEDWDRLKRLLEEYKDFKVGYAYLAASAFLLDSKKARELITEQDKQNCIKSLEEVFKSEGAHQFLFYASNLKLMGVDVKSAMTDSHWKAVTAETKSSLKENNVQTFAWYVLKTKLIDPERAAQYEPQIPWDKVISQIQRDTPDLPRAFTGDDEAEVKILKPEKVEEVFDADAYQNTLERLRFDLRSSQDEPNDLGQALEIAANLRILNAQEVKITDKGLEIIDRPALQTSSPSLPETKKF